MESIHLVSSNDSPEFNHLTHALTHSSLIGLDAEWKPIRTHQSTFPAVSLLQIACQLTGTGADYSSVESPVFLIDLASIHLQSIYQLLKDAFVSPYLLKLGFRFKQDLVYLSSTFCAHGCEPGFDRMNQSKTKSLATICQEVLGISLSKEQMQYAAVDAYCLIHIFEVFKAKVVTKGNSVESVVGLQLSHVDLGLKQIFDRQQNSNKMCGIKFGEALEMLQAIPPDFCKTVPVSDEEVTALLPDQANRMDDVLSRIVSKYGDKILLSESDRKPKISRKKAKKSSGRVANTCSSTEGGEECQGPPPWDVTSGGNGCPKFLCDVMVEGLAKHLRCVVIDAAVPYSKKPESRVLLTRDAKLLRLDCLLTNQIYRVKSLLKNDQLVEVKWMPSNYRAYRISGDSNCLFNKNLEFWQCMDCKQLYWEGTQYHNAVQKFVHVCKLNE
ncbi:unnamed protein product [Withania somnifera]